VHTSYGYVFNKDVSDLDAVEADFDEFLAEDGVSDFEKRAVIPFPNFVRRRNKIYLIYNSLHSMNLWVS